MAKYIYGKYAVNSVYEMTVEYNQEVISHGTEKPLSDGKDEYYYYKSYKFDDKSGRFEGDGELITRHPGQNPVVGYYNIAYSWGAYQIKKIGSSTFNRYYTDYYISSEVRGNKKVQEAKGAYVSDIIAENGTYPNDGIHTDGYWYVRKGLANTAPTIDGMDSNLGDKNLGFSILYKVDDADVADSLIVTEKLNGNILRTINGAQRNQLLEIEITNETLYSLELNSENTIEIKVDDQNGGIAYRRYTFRRTNTAPIISGTDEDLGENTEPFNIDFSVTDNEDNAITVKTYLNGVKKEEYIAIDGVTNTFTISATDWLKLPIGQHSIKIEATDEHGATAIRNYTFTRYDDKIQFTFKSVIETDIAATKILVTPTWIIPQGATAKVEVCNNGYDEIPAWEDITSQVSTGKHYIFTNNTKTADKWGIDIRFTIEKGTSTEECIVHGFGGAFE